MSISETLAQRLLGGDADLAVQLAAALIVPQRDNFVERPWGGTAIRRFKRLNVDTEAQFPPEVRIGEAFEIAAYDADEEAARFPSRVRLADGSDISLPELLNVHGNTILGAEFVGRFGACFPLLPKILDIRELLSVQGHPEGNTELYIIVEAEAGATIRLGFNDDVGAQTLRTKLGHGLERQRELARYLRAGADVHGLQRLLNPWFADRAAPLTTIEPAIRAMMPVADDWPAVAALLRDLKRCYWWVLDLLNEIPVAAGQVIYNATPPRVLAQTGQRVASAEVHALGNPEGREILALEIRRPGPTFRAWDNVRFPVREINVDAAIAALNLVGTAAADFRIEPAAVAGKAGVFRSVDSAFFRVEHLRPSGQLSVQVDAEPPHSLHVLAGAATVTNDAGSVIGSLGRGDSAIVPVGVGRYVVSADADADIVKVSLPAGD